MPYLSTARENTVSDSRLKLFNGLFRWKKSEKEKEKARQLSKSEVCIAKPMSVKTRNSCPASPALSIPRSRDVFQDMEALKISRHDNPYLQKKILASRESLLDDHIVVSETGDVDIMAQEYLADIGPGALIELHQHMVRSPPPTTWPRIPIFKYDEKDQTQENYGDRCKSPQVRSLFHSTCSSGSSSCVVSPRYNHQSRCHRSASEFRGGAGGKGVWGKLGDESDLDAAIDMKDPNYDSDLLDDDNIVLREITPESSDEELKNSITFNILEYYEHGDTEEVTMVLSELNIISKWHLITQVAVEVALEHKPSQREMTSILLSDMYGRLIKQKEIAQGFDVILANLPDLILDTPDAPIVVGCFLARAIADDCLPPKIIDFFKEKNYSDLANQALIKAHNLLSIKHGLTRLDNVWGVGGSLRPVQYLVRQMNMLLDEYLCSGDLPEAIRCILELEVPHFHHELVYEAVVDVIEAMNTHTEIAMCKLLKALYDAIIITPEMMVKGFDRVFDVLDDITIDVPLAPAVLERFLDKCIYAGFLQRDILQKIPTRTARKRYVSEGDGGRLKEA